MKAKLSLTAILVDDMKASRAFYESGLQQIVTVDSESHVSYEGGFSLWLRAMAVELIAGVKAPPREKSRLQNIEYELSFECDDIEAMRRHLLGLGHSLIHEIREEPWGQRLFRLCDPDGHVVEIGEPMIAALKHIHAETGDIEQTALRTHTPVDVLRGLLD
jgi:catechol 2,3-dioxygenase-like lactoylglutathione lyase family enzyme